MKLIKLIPASMQRPLCWAGASIMALTLTLWLASGQAFRLFAVEPVGQPCGNPLAQGPSAPCNGSGGGTGTGGGGEEPCPKKDGTGPVAPEPSPVTDPSPASDTDQQDDSNYQDPDGVDDDEDSSEDDDNDSSNTEEVCESLNAFAPYTGNASRQIMDLRLFGSVGRLPLNFTRFSNTRMSPQSMQSGGFGREGVWTHNYQYFMRDAGTAANGQPQIRIAFPNGGDFLFIRQATDNTLWLGAANATFKVVQSDTEYWLYAGDKTRYKFVRRPSGSSFFYRFEAFEDVASSLYTVSYNTATDNIVRQVTDESGRWLKLTYQDLGPFAQQRSVYGSGAYNAPTGVWQEIAVTSTTKSRFLTLFYNNDYRNNPALPVGELEFYDENNVKIMGAPFGSDPIFAEGQEADKAFDGDTSSYYRFAFIRNGYVGIDAGTARRVTKVRWYVPAGIVNVAAPVQFVGMNSVTSSNVVVKQVQGSDGRVVNYDYIIQEDPTGWFKWPVLQQVTYPDATKALYSSVQVSDYSRPVLQTSYDPRAKKGNNISYAYSQDTSIGYVKKEQSGLTGEVIAVTSFLSVHQPQAVYPNGKVVTYEHNGANGNMVKKISGVGAVTTFTYDLGGAGFKKSATNAIGQTFNYTRGTLGHLTSVTRTGGVVDSWNRDERGRPTSHSTTGPGVALRTTNFVHDTKGRLSSVVHADGTTKSWTYNEKGQVLTQTNRKGETRAYTYDANHRLVSKTRPDGQSSTYTYNALDLVASRTDALGRVTHYEYNDRGQVTKITQADGSTVVMNYDEQGNRISTTNALGQTATVAYDEFNRVLSRTDELGRTTTYSYASVTGGGCGACNAGGKPTLITMPDGSQTQRTYDAEWRLISETVAYGSPVAATTTYTYDKVNNLTKTTDALGRVTTYAYDSRNRRSSMTDPMGHVTRYTYDAKGKLLTTTRPDGTAITNTYDNRNLLVSTTNSLNQTWQFSYDNNLRKVLEVSPMGVKTRTTYDVTGRVLSVTRGADTAEAATTHYAYDAAGNQVLMRDPLNRDTVMVYDNRNRLVSMTDPQGRTTSYAYDAASRKTGVTQPNGAQELMGYDAAGQVVSATNALNQTISFSYDLMGRRILVTSPMGRKTRTFYDLRGRTTAVVVGADIAEAATTQYAYDAVGNLLQVRDPLNRDTFRSYNAGNQMVTVTDPLNRITSYAYDALHRPTVTTFADGTKETKTYDAANRVLTVKDGLNQITSYAYDADGRMISLTDGMGSTRQWFYDTLSRVKRKVHPDTTYEEYSYRVDGSVASVRTPAGAICTYNYGPQGLLLSKDWNDGTLDTTFSYDGIARLTAVANSASTVRYSYDVLSRKASESQNLNTMSYAYDADGNLAAFTYPDGHEVEYNYTARNQLAAVSVGGPPPVATYAYNTAGELMNRTLENGVSTGYAYDLAGQTTGIAQTLNNVPFDSLGYILDNQGRRTGITRANGKNDGYSYDAIGEVVGGAYVATATGSQTEAFAYDASGNRLTSVRNGANISYAPNANDQYTAVGGNVQNYDANGNNTLTSIPGAASAIAMTWDSENRMLSTQSSSARSENGYDALHRRVSKKVYTSNGSGGWNLDKTILFTYDGWNVILESEYGSAGNLARTLRYTWGRGLSGRLQGAGGVGGLLMAEEIVGSTATPHYYCYDGNGNVTHVLDAAGNVEALHRYTAFGGDLESITTTAFAQYNPWRFSTKYLDREVESTEGLYYYGYRFYLTGLGRWPSRDPIGERGGRNFYAACYNNLVNLVDGDGRAPMQGGIGGPPVFFPPGPPPPSIPSIGDQIPPYLGGPSAGDNLGNDDWFESNYGSEIEAHKEASKQHINEWIKEHCGESPYPGDGYWDVTLTSPNGGGHKQGTWERTAELGHFSIQTVTPVTITYEKESSERIRFQWSTTVRISDDLGFSDSDPWYFRMLQFASPPRNVTRGSWNLSDSGYCDCPE